MKIITTLLLVLGVVGAGWFWYTHHAMVAPAGKMPEVVNVAATSTSTLRAQSVQWEFRLIEDGVGDPMESPKTDVAVSFTLSDGATKGVYRLGSFDGSCSEQPLSGALPSRAFGKAVCWFAGAGTELVATQEDAMVHILVRGIDEGSAEETPPEEAFTEQLTVSL